MVFDPKFHDTIGSRLGLLDQRYTPLRRQLVEALASSPRPLTVADILAAFPKLPQSSVYRSITGLIDAGALRRVSGSDERDHFELAEEFTEHHHHLVCTSCGTVDDYLPPARLERSMNDAIRALADTEKFRVTEHHVEFRGICSACADA